MSSRLVAALALFITFSFATSLASAQTTYRWVDKTTGQTVFSDQPPPPGVKSVAIKQGGNADDEPQLPTPHDKPKRSSRSRSTRRPTASIPASWRAISSTDAAFPLPRKC